MHLFLLSSGSSGLLGGLRDLSSGSIRLVDGLDDSDGDRLPHVTHGETSEGSVVGEGLDAEGLGGVELDDAGVSVLKELRVVLDLLSGTAVDLLLELVELASDVG